MPAFATSTSSPENSFRAAAKTFSKSSFRETSATCLDLLTFVRLGPIQRKDISRPEPIDQVLHVSYLLKAQNQELWKDPVVGDTATGDAFRAITRLVVVAAIGVLGVAFSLAT